MSLLLQFWQALLDPILKKYPGISAADLWVFAAGVAVEEMGGPDITYVWSHSELGRIFL